MYVKNALALLDRVVNPGIKNKPSDLMSLYKLRRLYSFESD
jgi:hypothetical protein